VIAHSFGTYAIGRILKENPDIRLHRLVLCGAVLPTDFRWDQIRSRVDTDIINDCGIRDIWPVLAQSTTFGYGPSGRFGFGTPGVRDRFHNFGHGGFFEEKFVRAFWLPWFRMGQLVNSEAPPPSGTRWHLLTIIQIKWLAILLCAAGILWFALVTIPKHAYQKPPQTSKTEDVTHAAAIPSPLRTKSLPKTATLTYTTTTPQWVQANWISEQATTENRDGMRANGRSPTSPDGKWWASEKTCTLQVGVTGAKERLIKASFNFISGAGAFTEASGPFYDADARTVTATVKGWSGPATYELKAQIERQTDMPQPNTTSLAINNNPFTIPVPRTATNAQLTMAYDSQLLTVTIRQTSDPLIFVSQQDNGPLIEYTYKIKK